MNKRNIIYGAVLAISLLAVFLNLSSQVRSEVQDDKIPVTTSEGSVFQVEPEYVCMITNQVFAKQQIPVEVEGKTYYGCCEMCKAKLKGDPNSRVATDPVSGEKVDKALSIIGAQPDGSVYYFENKQNLEKFGGKNTRKN